MAKAELSRKYRKLEEAMARNENKKMKTAALEDKPAEAETVRLLLQAVQLSAETGRPLRDVLDELLASANVSNRSLEARPSWASILRAAICDVHLADGLQLADCGSQNAGWPPGSGSSAGIRPDCKLHVAARRMRPSGTKLNGLLRTFSDS